jgi:hypothetical protein
MPKQARAATFIVSIAVGALLFFLVFGAVFAGIWSLVWLSFGLYAVAGALLAWFCRAQAMPIALALIAPGAPWALWLFAATLREADLWRSGLWLAALLAMLMLAWAGGMLGAWLASRRN